MFDKNKGLKQFLQEHVCVSLEELRAHIRHYWQTTKPPRPRGEWTCSSIPDFVWNSYKPTVVGTFCPAKHLDEPLSVSEIPEFSKSAYPKCHAGNLMTFHLQQSASDLKHPNAFGIFEAANPGPEVVPDWIFVPALVADSKGNRIGRGGGFYDRYLNTHPEATTVGVLHSDYLFEDNLPNNWLKPHDCRLHGLLTEKEFFWCKEKNL